MRTFRLTGEFKTVKVGHTYLSHDGDRRGGGTDGERRMERSNPVGKNIKGGRLCEG